MIIYLIILFIILFLVLIEDSIPPKQKKLIVYTLGFFFCIFICVRAPGVDKDYTTYLSNWRLIKSGVWVSLEPLNTLIAYLSPSFFIYLLLYCVLGLSFKLKAIWLMSPLPLLSILIYYSHFIFLHEMTQIRIGVASGLILLALYYKLGKKYRISVICAILAFLFHYSAIVGVVIYFLNPYKNNLWKFFYIFIGCMGLYIMGISLISVFDWIKLGFITQKIQMYNLAMSMGQQDTIKVFNVAFLMQIFIGIILLILNNKVYVNKYILPLSKLYWIGLCSYLLLTDIPAFAFRVAEIFMIGEFILIPSIFYLFTPKALSKIGICMFGILYFVLNVMILKVVGDYRFLI